MKNKNLTLKIIKLLVTIAVIMIYFQVYWHYWFVKILDGYVVSTLLPIMLLFSVFIIMSFVSHDNSGIKKRNIFNLLILLLYYIIFASISIFVNEQGENIRRYLIYIYSPILIFVSILGMSVYVKHENIKFTLNLIFMLGIGFSIYVAFIFWVDPLSVSKLPVLETNRGFDVTSDTGASFGIGNLIVTRFTIPGISSTTYGPLLVPIIFIGFYFRRKSISKIKYFYTCAILLLIYCVFMTVSRGPFLTLIAGLIYLIWWKWFKPKEIIFIIFIFIISGFSFAKLLLLRIVITFTYYMPFFSRLLGEDVSPMDDPRLASLTKSLSAIFQDPFWGLGMSSPFLLYDKEHNNYLSIAASFGIPTLIFYLLFVILLFITMHKRINKISRNPLAKDLGIVLGAGFVSLIVYLNFSPAEFHFIWIWFGLSAAWLRNCEQEII